MLLEGAFEIDASICRRADQGDARAVRGRQAELDHPDQRLRTLTTVFAAQVPGRIVALNADAGDRVAKGAILIGALLALSIPDDVEEKWLAEFSRGLGADFDRFDCPLLGGDTTRTTGVTVISITAIGTVPRGTMVKRSGARRGEVLVVTGTIGDSALGLALRKETAGRGFGGLGQQVGHLADRYLLPQPRLAIADALRLAASAAIDVSDGLVGDTAKLAEASGVAATIFAQAVPLSEAAQRVLAAAPERLESVLTGGDDYEIVAAVPENRLAGLRAAGERAGVAITTIGRIESGRGVAVLDAEGQPIALKRASFSHF